MPVTIIQESQNVYSPANKPGNTQNSGGAQNNGGTTTATGTDTGTQAGQPSAIVTISQQAKEAANANQTTDNGTAGAVGAAAATQNSQQNTQNNTVVAGQNQQNPNAIWESFSKTV